VVKKLIEVGANSRLLSKGFNKNMNKSMNQNNQDTIKSMNQNAEDGFTAGDMAESMGHHNIASFLNGKLLSSSGQDQEALKGWLQDLGCGDYYSKFIASGYDFG